MWQLSAIRYQLSGLTTDHRRRFEVSPPSKPPITAQGPRTRAIVAMRLGRPRQPLERRRHADLPGSQSTGAIVKPGLLRIILAASRIAFPRPDYRTRGSRLPR